MARVNTVQIDRPLVTNKETNRQSHEVTDKQINTQTDSMTSELTNSRRSEEKSIIIYSPEKHKITDSDLEPPTKHQIIELITSPPGPIMAPPALADMTFSEQIRYLDSILLQLDPKYSPPELSPVHPLYTTVIKSPDEMEQVIRNYETRKRKRRGSVHCGTCKKQEGVVIRYHSQDKGECKQVEEACSQNQRASWWSISCPDDSTPSSDRSSEIEGKLRDLRIGHCSKLREYCERRAVLEDRARPEKKHRSLRKRLSSRVRSLSWFRGKSRTTKSSEQSGRGCVEKIVSASSSGRVSWAAETILVT